MSANISSPQLRIKLDELVKALGGSLDSAVDGNLTVTVGANDSGGTGYRALFVVPNA